METILLLQESEWSKLSLEERLRVLKVVADVEPTNLGVPETTLCADVLDQNTLGRFDCGDKTITLNLSYLAAADGLEMARVVAHEVFHLYQDSLVELFNSIDDQDKRLAIFNTVQRYAAEFSDYNDGSDNYEAYASQWVEMDADCYADNAILIYSNYISQYTQETGQEDIYDSP
jgi:hypothetical protein